MLFVILLLLIYDFFLMKRENIQFASKYRWFSNLTQQINAFIRISKILSLFGDKPNKNPNPHLNKEVYLQSSDEKTLKFGCGSPI